VSTPKGSLFLRFFLGGVQSPAALDLVKKTHGFDAEEVSNLQPLQFVAWNLDSGGELRGSIKL